MRIPLKNLFVNLTRLEDQPGSYQVECVAIALLSIENADLQGSFDLIILLYLLLLLRYGGLATFDHVSDGIFGF